MFNRRHFVETRRPRVLPFRSSARLSYSGNCGFGLLCFAQDNLPLNERNGVPVANHPNNAPSVPYGAANRPPGDPRAIDVPVIK